MIIEVKNSNVIQEFLKQDLIFNLNIMGIIKNKPKAKIYADKIKEKYTIDWENPCDLYYLPKENLNLSKIKNEVKSIDINDAETVDYYYTYREENSIYDIKDDILNRPSSAIYVNGEIVCWVLTHDDNSLGIMYTKKEHRRKGYAVDVTLDISKQHIKMGNIPFLHIVESNNMSPRLALGCGFIHYGKVTWFGIKVGNPIE